MGTRVSEDFQFWVSGSRNYQKHTALKPNDPYGYEDDCVSKFILKRWEENLREKAIDRCLTLNTLSRWILRMCFFKVSLLLNVLLQPSSMQLSIKENRQKLH